MRKLAAWTAGAMLLAGPAWGVDIYPSAGTTSATFLKIPVGARPVAMGEAFTAVAGDPSGILWNPASIATIDSQVLSGTHNESFESIRTDYAAYIRPLSLGSGGNKRVWSTHVLSLVPPSQDFRSGAGENDIFNPVTDPQGSFGSYDLAVGVTYAQTLGDLWSAGGTFQMIRQAIGADHAQTVAVNLGVQRKSSLRGLTYGASMLNFGPGVSFGRTFDLPLTFRAGAAYERRDLLLTFDASKPIDDYPFVAGGLEYKPLPSLYLRAGYLYRVVGNALGGFSGARFGVGLNLGNVRVDYAFAPFGDLGTSHRISIGIPWGGRPEAKTYRPEEAAAPPPPPPLPKMAAAETPSLPLPAPVVPVLSSTAPPGAFAVALKPRAITPQGLVFEVKASTDNAALALQGAEFKMLVPAAQAVSFETAESTTAGSFDVLPSSYTLYRLVRVTHNVHGEIRGIVMRLSVDAAWLKAAESRPQKLVLFRVNDGTAVPQMTVAKEEAGGAVRLEAMPDYLGEYWLLAAEKGGK